MSEEEILSELRAIRTLLTLDKEERLEEIVDDLNGIQEDVIAELEYEEWSSGFTGDVAEANDVSNRQVQREVSDLVEKNLIEKQGSGPGTEYRKSGLLRAADLANVL